MSTFANNVRFDDSQMRVELSDGRTLGVPLAWFPRLLRASPEQGAAFEISGGGLGLHSAALDEDISGAGLLAGRGDATRDAKVVA
jgi:hypothetical protein